MKDFGGYRKNVLESILKLNSMGFVQGTGGNVSVRIGDEELLAITPSQVEYETLEEKDICVVNFSLEPAVDNGRRPSIETAMHVEVYRQRPDAGAVVHTHQIYASLFAVINEPIPPLFDEAAAHIGNYIEVVPYALSGSGALIENIRSKISSGNNCYILQNHGAISLGPTLDEARQNAVLLEKTARIYYMALSAGREVTTLPADIQDLLRQLMSDRQDKERLRRSG